MKLHPLLRLLLTLCILALAENSHAQMNLGAPTPRTPYDPYLGPVWPVLRALDGKADFATASQLVRQGRAFRYSYNKSEPYTPQTPEETESKKAGDCKAKSLWLASKLNDRGVRFVIGKAKVSHNISHAWLIWNGPDGWMILDATLYSSPLSPSRIRPTEFVPTYSYAPGAKYAHTVSVSGASPRNADHL